MKTIFTVVILLSWMPISAQQALDTIFANEHKNVALFFPSPIRQAVTGSTHFVFTYNREKEQYLGLLQAQPGKESNLLVVTEGGQVYAYILRYAKDLPRLNYFVPETESIGNERLNMKPLEPSVEDPVSNENSRDYFNRACENLLRSKPVPVASKIKGGVKLQLQRIAYSGSDTYLVLEVTNRSEIDFEVDYLKVYRANGSKRRKASYQRLEQDVLYRHKMPGIVPMRQSRRFVIVVPKFVLGENEKLAFELKELRGSRNIILKDH